MPRFDGFSLSLGATGVLFVYAGVKGYSVPHAVQALVQGQPPGTGGQATPITGTPPSALAPGGAGTGGLATRFLAYAGKVPYVWDGASPAGWDCSGSCNYVICHDAGLDIPEFKGGTFTGASHGPSTYTWAPWAATHMTKVPEASVLEDDLVLWLSHMGVVTRRDASGLHYVSAYDTAEGTVEKPVHGGGPLGEIATFWRFNVAARPVVPRG